LALPAGGARIRRGALGPLGHWALGPLGAVSPPVSSQPTLAGGPFSTPLELLNLTLPRPGDGLARTRPPILPQARPV